MYNTITPYALAWASVKVANKCEKRSHLVFPGLLIGFKNSKNNSMGRRKGGCWRGPLREVTV